MILDEVGDGASDEHEGEAVDCRRRGGVAQILLATVDLVPVRLFALLVGARAKDLKVLLVIFVRVLVVQIHDFLLQMHKQNFSSSPRHLTSICHRRQTHVTASCIVLQTEVTIAMIN